MNDAIDKEVQLITRKTTQSKLSDLKDESTDRPQQPLMLNSNSGHGTKENTIASNNFLIAHNPSNVTMQSL